MISQNFENFGAEYVNTFLFIKICLGSFESLSNIFPLWRIFSAHKISTVQVDRLFECSLYLHAIPRLLDALEYDYYKNARWLFISGVILQKKYKCEIICITRFSMSYCRIRMIRKGFFVSVLKLNSFFLNQRNVFCNKYCIIQRTESPRSFLNATQRTNRKCSLFFRMFNLYKF